MKKHVILLALLSLIFISAKSQSPIISMTTSMPIGSPITFNLGANDGNTNIQVDFGDDVKIDKLTTTAISGFVGASQNIKIYGSGINYFNCTLQNIVSLDVTQATDLLRLTIDRNQIKTIDLSKNTKLTMFECRYNSLTSLDVSNNLALTDLICWTNKIKALDLSKNIALKTLSIPANGLESLNISNNPSLITAELNENNLTSLDISNDIALNSLAVHYNKFSFATLPIPPASLIHYIYIYQAPISISKYTNVGDELDLSNQYLINNNTTTYTWKTKNSDVLVEGTDYTISSGKTVFLRVPSDSVYCEMTNATFPDLAGTSILKTRYTHVTLVPTISFTTSQEVGSSISLYIAASATIPILADYGNGILVKEQIFNGTYEMKRTIVGSQNIKIYGSMINYFACNSDHVTVLNVSNALSLTLLECLYNQINTLDISKNIELENFDCTTNLLETIDISHNTALKKLSVSDNKLTSLDVSKNINLTNLYCDFNSLKIVDLSKNTILKELDLGYNNFTFVDITNNIGLTGFGCYGNKLTSIDVSKNPELTELIVFKNYLNNIDISQNTKLVKFYCDSNKLTFNIIPLKQISWTKYRYTHQAPININKSIKPGEELDLNNQYSVNGVLTSYSWKTKNGKLLIKDTDYTISEGKTTFLKAVNDSVYCELSNTTFPDFTNNDILKTTFTNIELYNDLESVKNSEINITINNKMVNVNSPYNAELYIYDAVGYLILQQSITYGENTISIQKTGVYIIKIKGHKNNFIRKIIIN